MLTETVQTSLLHHLSNCNSSLLLPLGGLPGCYELPTAPACCCFQTGVWLEPPEPHDKDRGICSFTVYRLSCTFPYWILSFPVDSFSVGRASGEKVPLLAPHNAGMGTEKSNLLGCPTHICHNEGLTKNINVKSFQADFFYYSLNVWKSCTYPSNIVSAMSFPTPLLSLLATWLMNYYFFTAAPQTFSELYAATFLPQVPILPPLEDTDIKSHDKALLWTHQWVWPQSNILFAVSSVILPHRPTAS